MYTDGTMMFTVIVVLATVENQTNVSEQKIPSEFPLSIIYRGRVANISKYHWLKIPSCLIFFLSSPPYTHWKLETEIASQTLSSWKPFFLFLCIYIARQEHRERRRKIKKKTKRGVNWTKHRTRIFYLRSNI